MSRARRTNRRRRRSIVARTAGLAFAGALAASLGACRDDVTGPEAPASPRGALAYGPLVAPTPLATPGVASGTAVDINDAGVVVGTLYGEAGRTTHVLWYPSGLMDTVPLLGVVGIGNGGTVGGSAANGQASVWTAATDVIVSAGAGYWATAMSPGGTVVGTHPRTITPECFMSTGGFVWTSGPYGPMDLGCAPGWRALSPNGVNGSALVVGNVSNFAPPRFQAFSWSYGSGIRLLGAPSSSSASALAVNGGGTIVGTYDNMAVTFGPFAAVPLAPELGASSAVAINDKGEIVIAAGSSAYLLRGSTLLSLQSLGGCCVAAVAVNEHSQVVGRATTPAGVWRPVVWNAAQLPLAAEINGPYAADEGTPIEFMGIAFGVWEPFTRAWSFGDGATAEGGRAMHAYADDGTYTVTFLVTNADGRTVTATSTATIANVAPTVSAGAGATILSGETFTVRARFDDPGALDAPWAWQLLDGAGPPLAAGSAATAPDSVIVPATLRRAGVHALALRVIDADGGVGTATVAVTVLRLPVSMQLTPASAWAASRGKGLLTVVVRSSERVDVADIDVTTVRLGAAAPATRGDGAPMAALEDVDGDGTMELVLKFERAAIAPAGTLLLHADLVDGRQVEGSWSW